MYLSDTFEVDGLDKFIDLPIILRDENRTVRVGFISSYQSDRLTSY